MENITFERLTNSVFFIDPFGVKAQSVQTVYHKFNKKQPEPLTL